MSKKILVVDDSVSIRKAVVLTLKKNGFEVVECSNGNEALNTLLDEKFDLIITDFHMPEINGLELVKLIRQGGLHKFVPIIMLTTERSEHSVKEAIKTGISGWIIKPFNPQTLLSGVEKFLRA